MYDQYTNITLFYARGSLHCPYNTNIRTCMNLNALIPNGFFYNVHVYTTELTIKGGHCSPYTYPKAISMIEKKQLPLEVGKRTQ